MWTQWLDRPRSVPARRALYQVHLWTGVILGLYILLMGITGAALVFRDEIEHGLEDRWPGIVPVEEPRADLDAVADRMRRAYPERTLTALVSTVPPNHLTIRGYLRQGDDYLAIDAHPLTGEILGVAPRIAFLDWLRDLHFNLLSGRTGRIVNGVGALCLLLMSLTGIVIWWPGRALWRRAITVDWKRRWKRVTWDLHGATGFWTLTLLAIWGVSGAYFAWPPAFRALVNAISPLSFTIPPPPAALAARTPPGPRLEPLLETARGLSPGARLLSVSYPIDAKGHLRIFLAREDPPSYDTADYHYFDPFTGKHLGVWHRGINRSAGDAVMAWIAPLHFGTFGGEGSAGIAIKVLWVLLGLSPAVLAVSGLLIYWNRFLSKKLGRAPGYTGSLPAHENHHFGGTRQVPPH